MIRIRQMNAADIPLGMRLAHQAGWNQTEIDWRRLLDLQADGCWVAERHATACGTTVAVCFGPVAWVAMVLVDKPVRGQGIGRALMEHALQWLERHEVRSVRLDATGLGRPVYERLGFVAQFELVRYAGALPVDLPGGRPAAPLSVESAEPGDWEELAELDRQVTGTDRRTFLERLFDERRAATRVARVERRVAGYVTDRPGSLARQLGPGLGTVQAAAALLADAASRYPGERVLLDVPVANQAAVELIESWQLCAQRTFVRMGRGPLIVEDTRRLWASSGPELG